MTRIAHLSDLHYGGAFDVPHWRNVEQSVIEFEPHLLVVSGDFVEDPREDHLRAAKQTLDKLAAKTGATLFWVPGNHDLFVSGLAELGARAGWFDSIFNDTGAPAAPTPAGPGFIRGKTGWRRLADRASLFLGIGAHAVPPPPPRQPRPDGTSPPMLREPDGTGVLLALIDSNATDQVIGLATGSVRKDDLAALDRELQKVSNGHLARIAVIHHHLLPIAFTAGRLVGSEPTMVLHNAGDVLVLLARHRFDLVLHGHKHRAQFARVDFDPAKPEGHAIAVASAGSAAMKTDDPFGNSYNRVTIEENGRITVVSLHYGAGLGPNAGGVEGREVRTYRETFEHVKRRAFARASERHPIACEQRTLRFDVSEQGDLEISHRRFGLRKVRGSGDFRERPHALTIPPYGRLASDLVLDETSEQAGYRIALKQAGDDPNRRLVILPRALGNGWEASFSVGYICANSIAMTQWEAEERARAGERAGQPREAGWNEEMVGAYVGHPLETLVLTLGLPPSLAGVRPYLRCERLRGFPELQIDDYGDARVPPDPRFDIDKEMTDAEEAGLRYDAQTSEWRLTIHRPPVGYRYRLRWKPPGKAPDEPIPSRTLGWREALLTMADRSEPTPEDIAASTEFAKLAELFRQTLGEGVKGEAWNVVLFVYDSARLAVRPVFWSGPWAAGADWRGFSIPLGEGIAGAAFTQRGILPWVKDRSGSVVNPAPFPHSAVELRTMLAVPVYHRAVESDAFPSPWGTIGAVSFGSSALATRIPALLNPTLSQDDGDMLKLLRAQSQAYIHTILRILVGVSPT